MPRIDKLEMQGFKSFASKTTVLLPSNFSVICGPNGSGKSNVLDGICFVLGRTSAKSLRADRMGEMIFNGGGRKPAAEFAKVTIYFDNSDKRFAVEESPVVVSRKVNRKGVSIYKLNGQTVTREKVLEVLRPAAILPSGHNIILQGDITDVIEKSPLERREIIDEVSGIAEFDEKRAHAARELQTVEDRLKEAAIVLNERAAGLKKLETEAGAAEKYKELTAELDKLRASLAKKKLTDAEAAMALLNQKITEREAGVKGLDIELAKVDAGLEAKEKELAELGRKLIDRSADIAVIKELERLRAEITTKRNRLEWTDIEAKRLDDLIQRVEALQASRLERSPAIKAILNLGRAGVHGTIANLSKVPSQYQTAIEVAAGSHLWDIVVADESVAIDCVNWLKSRRIGRATFLPLDKIRERDAAHVKKYLKQPGVVGLAIDLIQFDKRYWHAFSFVFGDTLIVDRIETARKIGIGNARMVTLDGDLVERSGAIIGGFYRSEAKAFAGSDETAKYRDQKAKLKAEEEQLGTELVVLERKLEKLTKDETAGGEKLAASLGQRQQLEQDIAGLRVKRKEAAEAKLMTDAELQNMRVKRARLEGELDNVKAEFTNYIAVKEVYIEMSGRALERGIAETIAAINGLGPVNMRAPEELAQLKPAYTELKGKVETLTAERDRVLGMMAEIEGRRKATFTATLTAITGQFRTVYKDLTDGDGDLKLEDPDDIESGLLIEACPPGRKVLNIDSMSGGEKTLTALAFLFAIQRARPAPFYILDEIDAALDKVNTAKVVKFLQQNVSAAQFIVISHNDATVAAADCVYGVSMESGESKLVGIRMPA